MISIGVLYSLKVKYATGPALVLRDNVYYLALPSNVSFNKFLSEGVFAKEWEMAKVTPLPNKPLVSIENILGQYHQFQ